jgi:hypothetical protein
MSISFVLVHSTELFQIIGNLTSFETTKDTPFLCFMIPNDPFLVQEIHIHHSKVKTCFFIPPSIYCNIKEKVKILGFQ